MDQNQLQKQTQLQQQLQVTEQKQETTYAAPMMETATKQDVEQKIVGGLTAEEQKQSEKTKDEAAEAPALQQQKHKETFKEKRARKKREKEEKKRQKEAEKERLGQAQEQADRMDADFLSQDDTELIESANESWDNMTSEEQAAIKAYTKEKDKLIGISYRSMNEILRKKMYRQGGGKDPSSNPLDPPKFETKENYRAVENGMNALQKATLPKDMIFRRGADINTLLFFLGMSPGQDIAQSEKLLKKNLNQINDGSHMGMDRGFLSTSHKKDGGFQNDVEFMIQGHKGDEAFLIGDRSQYPQEAETLFQAGTKFRIIKVNPPTPEVDHWKVYMETIPGVKPLRGGE